MTIYSGFELCDCVTTLVAFGRKFGQTSDDVSLSVVGVLF